MTDYTELVKFLRGLSPWAFPDASKKRMNDAAAAIEELLKVNRELREMYEDAVRKLPNRGEWVGVSPMVDTVQCSICGGQLFSEELETPYCPYCGAKMMEVQDGKNET